jgi:hypothetical protein
MNYTEQVLGSPDMPGVFLQRLYVFCISEKSRQFKNGTYCKFIIITHIVFLIFLTMTNIIIIIYITKIFVPCEAGLQHIRRSPARKREPND